MSQSELLVGVVGVDAKPEQRELPESAPPQWRENAGLRAVGKRVPRLDGNEKVTGSARYTFDIKRPGQLVGRVLRSPHPHARVHGVRTTDAEAMPGVKAVVVLPHLIGGAQEGGEKGKDSKLVPVVRYVGQPIAAVAAETAVQAEAALEKIKVDFEILPHVIDPTDARADSSPLVFSKPVAQAGSAGGGGSRAILPQKGNQRGPKKGGPRGKDAAEQERAVGAVLTAAQNPPPGTKPPIVVRATYKTQVQTHSALETHGLVAEWTGEDLTVWASTQGLYSVRDELVEYLGLAKNRVRVLCDYCGGGFGAKFGAGNYGVLAAMLAKKAGKPVRVCLDRREEHLAVGNRPGSEQNLTLAAEPGGKLLAVQLKGYGHGGTGAGAGFAGPAQGLYQAQAIYTEETDVFTHTGPLAAFRAPGHPQGVFAMEQGVDELCEKLGVEPLAFRELNDNHAVRRAERKRGAEVFGWSRRKPAGKMPPEGALGHLRRGLGMAQGLWYFLWNDDSHAEVRIHKDGTVELLTGVQDIGGGIRTPLAQVVAEELGLAPTEIRVSLGDTRLPTGPASGGSVTTASITPAARDAAYAAKQALLKEVGTALAAKEPLRWETDGTIAGTVGNKPVKLTLKQAAAKLRKEQVVGTGARRPDYGTSAKAFGQLGGVQFAEVVVDTLTGVVRVERIVAAHDCGRPINPMLVESQIHGGIIQGVSYALFEERRMDRRSGRMLNANFEQYKVAGALDVPSIDIVLLEELRGRSSTDAFGIGEPATVPTAAAIANAVYNAIGVRIRELPITPARVLAALATAGNGSKP